MTGLHVEGQKQGSDGNSRKDNKNYWQGDIFGREKKVRVLYIRVMAGRGILALFQKELLQVKPELQDCQIYWVLNPRLDGDMQRSGQQFTPFVTLQGNYVLLEHGWLYYSVSATTLVSGT